jgi:4-amino-4-deoxy-L-arabinose transferase-like glycosyltransferase
MAPWAFFVPLAVRLEREGEGERRLALLSWLWIATIVAFFSFSKSRRGPCSLPSAPAVALLAGEVALAFVTGRLAGKRREWFVGIAGALSFGFVAGGCVILGGALWRRSEPAALPVAFWGWRRSSRAQAHRSISSDRRVSAPVHWPWPRLLSTSRQRVMPALDAYKSARRSASGFALSSGR